MTSRNEAWVGRGGVVEFCMPAQLFGHVTTRPWDGGGDQNAFFKVRPLGDQQKHPHVPNEKKKKKERSKTMLQRGVYPKRTASEH